MSVTSRNETPFYLRVGHDDLFCVHTRPGGEGNGTTVVLLTGGGWMPSTHRNRMWVDLARRLASDGFHVVRFEYRGVGESTGYRPFFELNRPAVEDLTGVLDWLDSQGLGSRVVLSGTCFGGRTSLTVTPKRDNIAGIVLSATPVEDYLGASESIGSHMRRAVSKKTITRIRTRYPKYMRIAKARLTRAFRAPLGIVRADLGPQVVSDLYLRPLAKIIGRHIPVLITHGTEDGHYVTFSKGMEGRLGRLLDRAGDRVKIDIFDGELHGELTVAAQEYTIDRIQQWVNELVAQPAARRP